jgi:hypothetical protein
MVHSELYKFMGMFASAVLGLQVLQPEILGRQRRNRTGSVTWLWGLAVQVPVPVFMVTLMTI